MLSKPKTYPACTPLTMYNCSFTCVLFFAKSLFLVYTWQIGLLFY